MKYVKDLKEGDETRILLAVQKKLGLRDYRNKLGKFFVIEGSDKTGTVIVKYWGDNDEVTEKLYSEIEDGDVVEVLGECRMDGNTISINVNPGRGFIRKSENYEPERFLEAEEDIERVMQEIMKFVESVKDPHLSKLLDLFFSSRSFVDSFQEAPGGATGKYATLGGLAKHTLNVTKICNHLGKVYNLNVDLLTTAALLHDVGRMYAYEVDTTIKTGTRGKLLGHTVLSYNMVEEKIREIIDFPEEKKAMLLHAIVSHHSPIVDNVPQRIRTREAYVLFYADMIDLSLSEFGDEGDEEWIYSRKMGREIYLG